MKSQKPPADNKRSPRFLLLMPEDVRAGVTRAATINGRSITAEINIRLKDSLKLPVPPAPAPVIQSPVGSETGGVRVAERTRDLRNTELEEAILTVIRGMPPEKQLSFLTLFK